MVVDLGQFLLWQSNVLKLPPSKPNVTFKFPYMGTRPIKYYTEPVVACSVLGQAAEPKSLKTSKEQHKKPEVQCNTSLIYLHVYREAWRSFGLFRGNFRTTLSHKRNWPWSNTVMNICNPTQRVGCLWLRWQLWHTSSLSHLFLHSFPRFNKLCSPFSCSCHSFHQSSGYTMTNTKCEAPDEIYN